jgi:hypothetical protein
LANGGDAHAKVNHVNRRPDSYANPDTYSNSHTNSHSHSHSHSDTYSYRVADPNPNLDEY